MRHLTPLLVVLAACQPELTHDPAGQPLPDDVRVLGALPADLDLTEVIAGLEPGQLQVVGDATGDVAVIERVDPARVGTFSSSYVACPECNQGECEESGLGREIRVGLVHQGGSTGAHVTATSSAVNFLPDSDFVFNAKPGQAVDVLLPGTLAACATFSYRFDVQQCQAGTVHDLFVVDTSSDAFVQNDTIVLTPNAGSQSGQAYGRTRIDFSEDFDLQFEAFLGTNNGGADGLAVLFHADPAGQANVGTLGGALGVDGVVNGLAVVLDTYRNTPEPNADFLGFRDTDSGLLGTATTPNLENGVFHPLRITWDVSAQTLVAVVDAGTSSERTLTLVEDVPVTRLGGATLADVVLSAATGGATNTHQIQMTSAEGVFEDPTVLCD